MISTASRPLYALMHVKLNFLSINSSVTKLNESSSTIKTF